MINPIEETTLIPLISMTGSLLYRYTCIFLLESFCKSSINHFEESLYTILNHQHLFQPVCLLRKKSNLF
mgnify:CR=1 FL=1|jgi:hypothetical protein